MKILVKKDLGKFKAEDIVDIPDRDGIPKVSYWRKRLLDAKLDQCCEVVLENKTVISNEKTKTGGK